MSLRRIEKNKHLGKRCFIIATGPGLNTVDLSFLKDEITIGMNLILRQKDFTPDYLCVADSTLFNNHYDEIITERMIDGFYIVQGGCKMIDTYNHVSMGGRCTSGAGSTCRKVDVDDKYSIHYVYHQEKSGIFQEFFKRIRGSYDNLEMLRLDEYYIDPGLENISLYGCTTMDNLAIPVAVYLGCNEIYMIGSDGGRGHFYDTNSGRRHVEFLHVTKRLDALGVKLYNCDPSDAFPEVEYRKYGELF